jgi:hypothetical protein
VAAVIATVMMRRLARMRVTKPATFHFESASHASAGELVMTGLCFESFFGRSVKSCPTMIDTTIAWHNDMQSCLSRAHSIGWMLNSFHTP